MKNRKGFTIVELVIVIAVIAILAAVLIPTFTTVTRNAKINAAMQTATNTMKSLSGNTTTGSLDDGTMFAVNDDNDTEMEYWFAIEGRKMTQIAVNKEGYPAKKGDAAPFTYTVFVTADVVDETDSVKTEARTLVQAQLLDVTKVEGVKAWSWELATDYFVLTAKDDAETPNTLAIFNVYYSADVSKDIVVFVK